MTPIQEGLVLGQDGRVVCGTMSNLFLQSGDEAFTRDATEERRHRRRGRGWHGSSASDSGQVLEVDVPSTPSMPRMPCIWSNSLDRCLVRVGASRQDLRS